MGFFSWKTADKSESVANVHSGHSRANVSAFLLQPDRQDSSGGPYNGYGVFGGVDAYAWLAKMNLDECAELDLYSDGEQLRSKGIELAFSDQKIKFPIKVSYDPNAIYEDLPASENCDEQGFFYDTY